MAPPIRTPHWYLIPLRPLVMTFATTLMTFAVTLFASILVLTTRAKVNGVTPDMRIAYREIAAPTALIVGAIVLLVMFVLEVRHYRQSRALADIERASR